MIFMRSDLRSTPAEPPPTEQHVSSLAVVKYVIGFIVGACFVRAYMVLGSYMIPTPERLRRLTVKIFTTIGAELTL